MALDLKFIYNKKIYKNIITCKKNKNKSYCEPIVIYKFLAIMSHFFEFQITWKSTRLANEFKVLSLIQF